MYVMTWKSVQRSGVDVSSMMWTKVCHSFCVGYDDKVVMCSKESEALRLISYL